MLTVDAFSQNEVFTVHKDNVPFVDVINELRQVSAYNYFYNPVWCDSLRVSVNADAKSLSHILGQLCAGTNLSFAVVESNVVFTKDYLIKTNYADTYRSYLASTQAVLADTIVYQAPQQAKYKEERVVNNEYQLFRIGNPNQSLTASIANVRGYISDVSSGQPIVGVVVYVEKLKLGVASNIDGYYSLPLPKGQYKIEYRSMGMETTWRNVVVYSDGDLNVLLAEKTTSLNEVVVTAKGDDDVRNLQMGVEKLSMKTLKQLPMGFGEADVVKSTLLLPGVQSVGEASGGYNVRGGGTDQNLMLLGDAPIMNTSHFFGFFSGFNADVIEDITLYKSGVPAKYGGRVSSVMNITLKEGDAKKTNVSGGISPVFLRLSADGPIQKEKSSFAIGVRSTYSDWVLKILDDPKLQGSSAGFYDVQGNFTFKLNPKNTLNIMGYYSHDAFDYYSEDAFEYNTLASTIKLKHTFNTHLYSTFSGTISNYDYSSQSRYDPVSMNQVDYQLNQSIAKADFVYLTDIKHKIEFGASSIMYNLDPGKQMPLGDKSSVLPKELESEQALESALYLSDEFELSYFMSLSAGLRYTFYNAFGPKTQNNYEAGQPRNLETISGTTTYNKETYQFYAGPEFRLASNIRLSGSNSIKVGLSRMYQYIQMMSNTAAMTPTDIWKLSDQYIKPQQSDQISIGFYQNINKKKYEFSAETYFKKLTNILDYKGGARLVMNEHLETDVINGIGKAYGAEFMIEKKTGDLTGWVNYTYSRIFHKIDGVFDEDKVNGGDYFPANYDKPNDFKVVCNYKMGRRFNISSNFFYSTGRPYTGPLAYFQFQESDLVYYSDRNSLRMDNYIRLDLAATLNGSLINKKKNHSSWTFSVYNILGRKNPYSVFFRTEEGQVKGYKMSVVGQPIFTVTYNFKIFGNASTDY